MRTITKTETLYTAKELQELHPEGFEKAMNDYMYSIEWDFEFEHFKEWIYTLSSIIGFNDLKIERWDFERGLVKLGFTSFDLPDSWDKLKGELSEESEAELRVQLNDVRELFERFELSDYTIHYPPILPTDVYSDCLIDSLNEVKFWLERTFGSMLRSQYDYLLSESAFIEYSESLNYEYLECGTLN